MTCANCNKSLSLTPSITVGEEHSCEKCFTSLAVDTLLNSVTPKCSADNHKVDPVNHPPHYTAGGVECIEAIEAALTREEFIGYLKGQMMKYIWRSNYKGALKQDIEKCLWYGDRLTKTLSK
jgi:hypothetical protein